MHAPRQSTTAEVGPREPRLAGAAAVGIGAAAMALSVELQTWLLFKSDALRDSLVGSALLVAVGEEAAKAAAVLAVLVAIGRRLTRATPGLGLRLGLLAGLGAGLAEAVSGLTLADVRSVPHAADVALVTSVRLTMHALWGALGGHAVAGLWRRPTRGNALRMLAAAVALHAAWDRWIGLPPRQDELTRVIAQGLFAVSLGTYAWALRGARSGAAVATRPRVQKPAVMPTRRYGAASTWRSVVRSRVSKPRLNSCAKA